MSGTIPEHTVLTGLGKDPKEFVNIIAAVSSASASGKNKLIKEDTIFKEGATDQIPIVADENYPGEGISRA